jgi:ribonuclease HI
MAYFANFVLSMQNKSYIGYFDGCCEPFNPGGDIGAGAVLFRPDASLMASISRFYPAGDFPLSTYNIAEYLALISLLEVMTEKQLFTEPIILCGDSMLVIRQMAGRWRVRKGAYLPYHQKARELALRFSDISFRWVSRESNQIADSLSRQAVADHFNFVHCFSQSG